MYRLLFFLSLATSFDSTTGPPRGSPDCDPGLAMAALDMIEGAFFCCIIFSPLLLCAAFCSAATVRCISCWKIKYFYKHKQIVTHGHVCVHACILLSRVSPPKNQMLHLIPAIAYPFVAGNQYALLFHFVSSSFRLSKDACPYSSSCASVEPGDE
uniref:Secreted protein n=1 Tax=Anopheles darlingi TaxID=43151 RepID=A0A2M4DAY2_ANODA